MLLRSICCWFYNVAHQIHACLQARRTAQLARLSAAAVERERNAALACQRELENRLAMLERDCCLRC